MTLIKVGVVLLMLSFGGFMDFLLLRSYFYEHRLGSGSMAVEFLVGAIFIAIVVIGFGAFVLFALP
jgi:hypothetical protein